MDHHVAQRTLARMLFDPVFAEAVRHAPATVGVPSSVAAMLATVDERALRADPLRRRRTLGALVEELKYSTAIAVAERRSLAFLESFFASHQFHAAMQHRSSLALAYGEFLLASCATGELTTPRLPDVIRLELMQARARREEAPVVTNPHAARLKLTPGVVYGRLGGDVLDTIARVERYQLELSIVPQAALCQDAPRLQLPPLTDGIAPLDVLVVPSPSGIALVLLDEELAAVIAPLAAVFTGDTSMPRAATPVTMLRSDLAHAATQQIIDSARAHELITELLTDEILAPA